MSQNKNIDVSKHGHNANRRPYTAVYMSSRGVIPDLTGDSLWRLSLRLQRPGQKDSEAIARVRFVPDRNYEPPQGKIFIEDDFNGLIQVDEKGYSGTWSLSEDKNDRKDGLWIWGK